MDTSCRKQIDLETTDDVLAGMTNKIAALEDKLAAKLHRPVIVRLK